jgi:hypothetical protein
MKVLFLNPPDFNKVSESTADEKSQEYIESDDFGAFPPLGIMYVMAYLEKQAPHHKLYFKDCVAERYGHKNLIDYVTEIKPDIVAMTSFTISMIDVVIAAQNIKKILPNVHICLGVITQSLFLLRQLAYQNLIALLLEKARLCLLN